MSERMSRGAGGPRRTRERPGVRASSLSRESIVEAALELMAREGAGALTLRRLGSELGVDATAFYRHFPDKDSLVLAVGDHVAGWALERVEAQRDDADDWRDTVRLVARTSWQAARLFPAAAALTFARTTGEVAERRMVELLLATVEPLGLDPATTVRVYRMFGDAILAITQSNALLQSLEPTLQDKNSSAWSRIYAAQQGDAFPVTRRHVAELLSVTEEDVFEFTIENLIRGVEALLEGDPTAGKS
jgi:AcrR family transcriptional regulator